MQVQWFERSRLELHPENARPFDVLLGRVGADRLAEQGRDWFQFARPEQRRECLYIASTGHNICGAFLAAWRAAGVEFDGSRGKSLSENAALFGLPLSEEQADYISVPVNGPFKPDHYRY